MALKRCGWLAIVVALIMPGPADLFGQRLYEQAPGASGGLFSNSGGLIAADQFVLRASAPVTAMRWHGFFEDAAIDLSHGEPAPLSFRLRFFADASGVPGREIARQDVSARARNTGVRAQVSAPGKPLIYEFDATLPPVPLDAGPTLWVSISAIDAPASWLWSRSNAAVTDTLAVKDEAANQNPAQALDWQSNGQFGQLAFTLSSGINGDLAISTPEPPPPNLAGPAATTPSKPFSSGSTERPLAIAQRAEPQYTDFASRARVNGTVVLDVLVNQDGTPSVMGIVHGLGFGLDEAAQAAMQQWRFHPRMRDGRPVNARFNMEMTFRLP